MIETILALISIFIALIALEWKHIKKYIPFLPKPFIRITYQISTNYSAIVIENIGNDQCQFLTIDVSAKKGVFKIESINADFYLKTSGQGGSWTTITAKDILPQHKGAIVLSNREEEFILNRPKVKSDSRYKFYGTLKVTYENLIIKRS